MNEEEGLRSNFILGPPLCNVYILGPPLCNVYIISLQSDDCMLIYGKGERREGRGGVIRGKVQPDLCALQITRWSIQMPVEVELAIGTIFTVSSTWQLNITLPLRWTMIQPLTPRDRGCGAIQR